MTIKQLEEMLELAPQLPDITEEDLIKMAEMDVCQNCGNNGEPCYSCHSNMRYAK